MGAHHTRGDWTAMLVFIALIGVIFLIGEIYNRRKYRRLVREAVEKIRRELQGAESIAKHMDRIITDLAAQLPEQSLNRLYSWLFDLRNGISAIEAEGTEVYEQRPNRAQYYKYQDILRRAENVNRIPDGYIQMSEQIKLTKAKHREIIATLERELASLDQAVSSSESAHAKLLFRIADQLLQRVVLLTGHPPIRVQDWAYIYELLEQTRQIIQSIYKELEFQNSESAPLEARA